jgi:hypothetical protein
MALRSSSIRVCRNLTRYRTETETFGQNTKTLPLQIQQLAPRARHASSSTARNGRHVSQTTIRSPNDVKRDNESNNNSNNNSDTPNDIDIEKRPRNKTLESVIREGLGFLNQTVTQIQANKHTNKPLLQAEDTGPTDKQKAEEHRILNTTTICLDEMSQKDPCLCIHGEPIILIRVEVNSNMRLATVYWALPYTVMLEERLSADDKRKLTQKMNEIVMKHGGKLQRRVHGRLSSYYPPRLKFEPAPAVMTEQAVIDFDSW